MIRITQLKLPVDHRQEQLRKKIARTLKCGEDTFSYEMCTVSHWMPAIKKIKNLFIQ